MRGRLRRLSSDPRLVKRLVVLGVVVLVIGGLAGALVAYTGRGDEQTPRQAVQGAYGATTSARSVKVMFRQKVQRAPTLGQAGASQSTTGTAQLDYANDASSVTVNSAGGSPSRTVTVGRMLYQPVPKQQRKQIPGHKPWVKVDRQQLAQAQYGPKAGKVTDSPPSDPAQMLIYLRGATWAKSAESGHYTAKVDLKKAVQGRDPETRAQAMQLEQQTGKQTLTMQVTLDQHRRVRSLETTFSPASSGTQVQSQPQRVTLSEVFHSYGTPVDAQAPAASQTADITKQVIQQQQQQQLQQQQQQLQQQPQQPNGPHG